MAEETDPDQELTPEGILVEVANPVFFTYPMQLIFYRSGPYRHIYVKLVVIKKHPTLSGVGALILTVMLDALDGIAAKPHKFSELAMLAAGGRTWDDRWGGKRWDGFAVWPRYGFDMPLLKRTTEMFPHFHYVPPLATKPPCDKVGSLIGLDQGLAFWDLVGDGWYMKFDTSPRSYSRKTLKSYLGKKYS